MLAVDSPAVAPAMIFISRAFAGAILADSARGSRRRQQGERPPCAAPHPAELLGEVAKVRGRWSEACETASSEVGECPSIHAMPGAFVLGDDRPVGNDMLWEIAARAGLSRPQPRLRRRQQWRRHGCGRRDFRTVACIRQRRSTAQGRRHASTPPIRMLVRVGLLHHVIGGQAP